MSTLPYAKHKQYKKLYYSFNTFAFLSNGSINDFISLCRHTFYQLDSSYFSCIREKPLIPARLQTRGAKITAEEQLDKLGNNNENGLQMHTYVMNIGNLFSLYHKKYGEKYPETNQFAFVDEAAIEACIIFSSCLKSMLKWGAIIKKGNKQSITAGKRKGSIYYLNHIFAPIFNISYRLRGGINPTIPTDLFGKMISSSLEAQDMFNALSASNKKSNDENFGLEDNEPDDSQLTLFELGEKHE